MKMVCIDNERIPDRLTIGKEYDVAGLDVAFVWVDSDDGIRRPYRRWRFSTREELREKKLKERGI
jgi:hypothetical protein